MAVQPDPTAQEYSAPPAGQQCPISQNDQAPFYSWRIRPAARRTSPRLAMSLAGSTVAMAGLAAGLAVGLPGGAVAQQARSGRPALTAARAAPATGTASALLPDVQQLASLKAADGRAEQHQIVLAIVQGEARRAASRRAAERRVWAARAVARAAAAQQAAARQTANLATASAPPTASGSPQQTAQGMLASFGWSPGQFSCLDQLWTQESGWNVYASNPSSGAYGIPQALPGSKMASAGANWQTSAATQIRWGLGYIQATYGSPCGAWAHEQANGWY